MKRLIIIGASGHGKVVAEIALHNGYWDIAFLDDDTSKERCMGFPIIGISKDFIKPEKFMGNFTSRF